MKSVVLLYCTDREKLAADVKDFLESLDLKVIRIPKEPNLGLTLDAKESHYLKSGDAFLFILTPDVLKKDGRWEPSPSVSKEMGIVQEKYKDKPEKIIYLVDKGCTPPTIDQKAYIPFNNSDPSSIWNCASLLIKDLKAAGIFVNTETEKKHKSVTNISEFTKNLDDLLKNICIDLSSVPKRASFKRSEIEENLKRQYRLNPQDTKFVLKDLESNDLVECSNYFYRLTDLGLEVARHESKVGKYTPDQALLKTIFGKQQLINESRLR